MVDDQHYYVAGYSAEDDPYSQNNGVLINKFGITNTQDLNQIEADYAALAISEILQRDAPTHFDIDSLVSIHLEIFSEIYPWAGKFRQVDIAKGDTVFERHDKIVESLDQLFAACWEKQFLTGLPDKSFAMAAAEFLIEINRIHPFREGNGRTQRLLLSQIARNAGFTIKWEGVSESAMRTACVDGLGGNPATMARLIYVYLASEQKTPDRH